MDAAYLEATVSQALVSGLAATVEFQPEDSVDFLGKFLIKYAETLAAKAKVRVGCDACRAAHRCRCRRAAAIAAHFGRMFHSVFCCVCGQLAEEDAQAEVDAKEAASKVAASQEVAAAAAAAAGAKASAEQALVDKLASAPVVDDALMTQLLDYIQSSTAATGAYVGVKEGGGEGEGEEDGPKATLRYIGASKDHAFMLQNSVTQPSGATFPVWIRPPQEEVCVSLCRISVYAWMRMLCACMHVCECVCVSMCVVARCVCPRACARARACGRSPRVSLFLCQLPSSRSRCARHPRSSPALLCEHVDERVNV
jgi:hypothetical protein